MNKVLTIEVAGQVLLVDEPGYERLRAYLETIRATLSRFENSEDIYLDIELRVAELLCERHLATRAISAQRIDEVIAQVGYIDDEPLTTETPKQSFRDPTNRILAGVCAGLAARLGAPALLIRLLFVLLLPAFGLGLALYLFFWLTLNPGVGRSAALAARGKAPTAAHLAHTETHPALSKATLWQRRLFFPLTMLASCARHIAAHLKNRAGFYRRLAKFALLLTLVIALLGLAGLLIEFTGRRLFPWPVVWLLCICVVFLAVLGSAWLVGRLYLRQSAFRLATPLKWGAIAALVVLALATIQINFAHNLRQEQIVLRQFALESKVLTLALLPAIDDPDLKQATISLKPVIGSQRLTVRVHYIAEGENVTAALRNIAAIDYGFRFAADQLQLEQNWRLREGALRRGQRVHVEVEIPEGITVHSPFSATVRSDDGRFDYPVVPATAPRHYLSNRGFLHETQAPWHERVSNNEQLMLRSYFCAQYFVSEPWQCENNLQRELASNARLDRSVASHGAALEQIRVVLQREVLTIAELQRLSALVTTLDQLAKDDAFVRFLAQLIEVKTTLRSPTPGSSG